MLPLIFVRLFFFSAQKLPLLFILRKLGFFNASRNSEMLVKYCVYGELLYSMERFTNMDEYE